MTPTPDNGWELGVTRYIAAPPEQVWDIMTRCTSEWWCPKPWRAEIVEQDWRSGGRTAMIMHGPTGEEHRHEGIFLEVTPGVRFVSTDALIRARDGSFMPKGPFMVGCWEIQPEGEGTRYTAWSRHWDEGTGKRHAEMGFAEGWGACADQLAGIAEGVAA